MNKLKYLSIFVEESKDNLQMISNSLLALEKNPHDLNEINIIFRGTHTLKGMSAAMEFKAMSELTHKMEDLLTIIKSGLIELNSDITNTLFNCIDILTLIVNTIDNTENGEYDISSVSAEIERINLHIEKSIKPKEIITPNSTNSKTLKNEKRINNSELNKGILNNRNKNIKVEVDKLDEVMNLVSEVIAQRLNLEQITKENRLTELNETLEDMMRTTAKLQNLVEDISMMPLEVVFNRFPRMMRDLSVELNKEINFVIEGKETKMDRTVIEEIGEPLIQLLRNAIDHGIESNDDRIKKGKEPIGNIRLTAYQEGKNAIIKISDDGCGIDTEALRLKRKSLNLEEKKLDKDEIKKLIFTQGFSTKDTVTNISGRGVGMSIVKSKIDDLGGSIDFYSENGLGSTFIIKIPLTLRILAATIVKIGENIFAIPLSYIYRIISTEEVVIEEIEDKRIINYMGNYIPIVNMYGAVKAHDENFVIIVKVEEKILAFLVDAILEQREIAIKPLGKIISGLKEYMGATILMNGKVVLILDISAFKVM
ncbi:chemotaxis protein CheA [Clostridium cadaveris]|uniref:chemotaxis protein CheA n=1 Tax=Clostridium cadaveris TaxID=1529 RepID=UPI001E2C7DDE|nr:chemotaxis protein CheA [Clostridium cadaveris]UFH66180.1 chemotaxis protein CheA [Clostridium cadaveris]